jgi:hypothetical protein
VSQMERLGSLERKLSPPPFTGCESCGDPWPLWMRWGTATLPCPGCGCTMMRLNPDNGRIETFDYSPDCMRGTG